MTRRLHVLNARLLLAFLIASLGMAGIAGDMAAQSDDDQAPVAEASPAGSDDGSGEADTSESDTAVSALPETGQGSAATADSVPVLLLIGIAGVVAVAGVTVYRTRRA